MKVARRAFAFTALLLLLGCQPSPFYHKSIDRCWVSTTSGHVTTVRFEGVIIYPATLIVASRKCPGFRAQSVEFSNTALEAVKSLLRKGEPELVAVSGTVDFTPVRLVHDRVLEVKVLALSVEKIGDEGDADRIIELVRQRHADYGDRLP